VRLGVEGAAVVAALHARCLAPAWDEHALRSLLAHPGTWALVHPHDGPSAFILCRVTDGEAEILAIGVLPERRRQGLARTLLSAALARMETDGAERAFLEVAADNVAACALYARCGFVEVGRRRAYYARPGAQAQDARVLARALAPSPAQ
jgi:ribosomal-protein-alanine N-acetyltransferase